MSTCSLKMLESAMQQKMAKCIGIDTYIGVKMVVI